MRILIVHNQLWAHYKSVLFEEIEEVLQSTYPGSELLVAHIALHEQSRSKMAASESPITYHYPYKVLFQQSLDSVGFSQRLGALFRLFSSYNPDVLNITGYYDYAQVLLMLYAKLRGVKTVISSESSPLDRQRNSLKETLKKQLLRKADAFFCFGSTTVAYLRTLGIPDTKIAVRKAAVVDNIRIVQAHRQALQSRSKASSLRQFVYVGRLAPEKNLEMLLQAYKEITSGPVPTTRWGLMLVGDGPERANLEKYVGEHQLDQVTFTGGIAWHEVPQWLALADVLVLPSLSEPWGLVVNEAMLCQMPVIVSEQCGCVDDLVQEGNNGLRIDPLHKESLVQAMRLYMDHPDLIPKHGARSLEIITPLSPKKVAAEMASTFYTLAHN
jgi:glycosyltransferase involved in cell wall biosynthesis